ncbi:MAG: hypothetical protein ACOC2Y_00030 [Spirochaetota bacterium]
MNTLTLSPQRLLLLIRRDLVTERKDALNGLATLTGIVVALFMISSATGDTGGDFHSSLFINILVIGGFVVSSMAFSDLKDPKTGLNYIMIPGSTLEKYLAKLLLTSVGWTLAVIMGYTAATALAATIAPLFFATTPGFFLPVGRDIWNAIAAYLVTQSVFLFGSVYFKKAAFIKTALWAVLAAASLAIVYLATVRLAFAPAFEGFFLVRPGIDSQFVPGVPDDVLERLQDTLTVSGKILYWAVMPVFFWVAGVLRLRETEV